MKILYILHADFETPGFIESWVANRGYEGEYVCPYKGEKIIRKDYGLIIVMGGPQSATEIAKYPYLKEEIDFIRRALQAKKTVLGFCLGAQLIGEALGASTMPSKFKEVGVFPITLTEEGMVDPLLVGLPKEFLVSHWHNDMPGLTKESVILARSEGCPHQIVRYLPHAYGFQCHPEMTKQGMAQLIEHCASDLLEGKYVQSKQEILAHDFHGDNYPKLERIMDNSLQFITT